MRPEASESARLACVVRARAARAAGRLNKVDRYRRRRHRALFPSSWYSRCTWFFDFGGPGCLAAVDAFMLTS